MKKKTMAITLFDLLDLDAGSVVCDDSAVEKIYENYELAGLYAKLFKLTSSYTVSGIAVELQAVLEGFSVAPLKRYSTAGENIKSMFLAMALTELCELAGLKTDSKNIKKKRQKQYA